MDVWHLVPALALVACRYHFDELADAASGVASAGPAIAVRAGGNHTCALHTSGWAYNDNGEPNVVIVSPFASRTARTAFANRTRSTPFHWFREVPGWTAIRRPILASRSTRADRGSLGAGR